MTLVRKNTASYSPSILDELLQADWLGGSVNKTFTAKPSVNIIEKDASFEVQVAAPGLTKERFNIELDNDLLTISAKIEGSAEVEGTYTRKEFNYSAFKRSFNLPESVNTAEISATYENGILHIALPKREEAQVQPSRLIEIA